MESGQLSRSYFEAHQSPITKLLFFQGLAMSDFAKGKLADTGKELCEERDEAMAVCKA